jgi:site-specific DNA recombinase
MYVAANNPKYFCRKCRNKIPIVDLKSIVHQELNVFFGQTERIASHLQEANRNLTEKLALLDTHRREIFKVKDSMHQTHELYLNKQISGDGFRDLYGPAEIRMKQLQAELPRLEADVDFLKVNKFSADDVLHEAGTLYENWPSMPTGGKRKIVEALIEKVTIGNGEIDITFSHLPSSEELCKNQQQLGLMGEGERM